MKKIMKRVLIVFLFFVFCVIGIAFYIFKIDPVIWTIDSQLKSKIENDYGLVISEDAEYVIGKSAAGIMDSGTYYELCFKTKAEESIMGNNWFSDYTDDTKECKIEFMDAKIKVDEIYYTYKNEMFKDSSGTLKSCEGKIYKRNLYGKIYYYVYITEYAY